MDYKDTLILPNTDFPMRGNLTASEPPVYTKWQEKKIYEKMLKANGNSKDTFNLHDGPPYANGHLHIGHALNKILKDIVVKYHYFKGEKIAYTPGWDCHGLPIEQKVEEKLGKAKKDALPKSTIRQMCRDWAQNFLTIQSEEFQALGVLGNFKNPYKTMDYAFEAQIYRSLCQIAKEGLLVQRLKPIYWSWACETALADAEVEYQDKVSDSIFVKFALSDEAKKSLKLESSANEVGVVIWTTTPWTLPANVGIAINPNEVYVLAQNGCIVAKSLFEKLKETLGLQTIMREFSAKELENLKAINPLNGRDSVLILAEYVSLNDGSGAVHTAPGHGEDDYYIGLEYGLEVIMPVDDKGNFSPLVESLKLLPNAKEFVGQHIFDAQPRILELLGENLLHSSKITHSYPHCWRSHKPVIYRATTQWFILLDEPFFEGKTLRQIALNEIEKTTFYPQIGRNRIYGMVQNRPDWCISRQRDWGVPIAFFIDNTNGEAILDSEVLEHIAQIFEKQGCDAWWEREVEELLPQSWKHRAKDLQKGKHILDVWFDSGSTWSAVLQNPTYNAGAYPASMYLEGSDQHRGWFQSSLLVSCAINKKAPYKSVLTHGFTMDANGRKMSKSLGNVVLPQEVIKQYGSEILRLWVALSDYQNDQRISNEILKQISEQYKKVRNTIRFLLANTQGLENLTPLSSQIDSYIVALAQKELNTANALFGEYEFAKGFSVIMNFLSTHLSGVYMDLCKDSLYCDGIGDSRRLSIQSAMALILRKLLFTIAPVLTYTAYEAFSHASELVKNGGEDIFDIRDSDLDSLSNLAYTADFTRLMHIREKFGECVDGLKKEKLIKSSLELCVISPNKQEFSELERWLIVSECKSAQDGEEILGEFGVENTQSKTTETFYIARAKKHKCPRCWQFIAPSEDCLCVRCKQVVG